MMKVKTDPRLTAKMASYPDHIRPKMDALRNLIWETAEELNIPHLEETLKWGEPSFLTKKGSTLRMDWKEKSPEKYALYFKCTSKLVPTFISIFGDLFTYETTRAISFNLNDTIPVEELKICIGMTLRYHEVKQLPLLGFDE